jgi:Carboxypeptidase regulatory-like domain
MEKLARNNFAATVATLILLVLIAAPVMGTSASAADTAARTVTQDAPAKVLLQGAVTDATGKMLTDAQLIVHWDPIGAKTGLTTNVGIPEDRFLKTDTHGAFYAEIPPGFYDVLITAPGFTPECRKIRLKPNQNQTLNSKLQIDPAVAAELAAAGK